MQFALTNKFVNNSKMRKEPTRAMKSAKKRLRLLEAPLAILFVQTILCDSNSIHNLTVTENPPLYSLIEN